MATLTKTSLDVRKGELTATITMNGAEVPVVMSEQELLVEAAKDGQDCYTNDDVKTLAKQALGLIAIE